jgi:hypothetical protein
MTNATSVLNYSTRDKFHERKKKRRKQGAREPMDTEQLSQMYSFVRQVVSSSPLFSFPRPISSSSPGPWLKERYCLFQGRSSIRQVCLEHTAKPGTFRDLIKGIALASRRRHGDGRIGTILDVHLEISSQGGNDRRCEPLYQRGTTGKGPNLYLSNHFDDPRVLLLSKGYFSSVRVYRIGEYSRIDDGIPNNAMFAATD